MQIGFLTAPFSNAPLEQVVEFAGQAGFDCLEVVAWAGGNHINTQQFDERAAEQIASLFEEHDLGISALASYANPLHPDLAQREQTVAGLRASIDAAKLLGVGVVCTLAGHALPQKSRLQTIEEDCASVFNPLCDYAAERGVKIALENWYATNLQNLEHFERLFEVVSHSHLGLNFDPSHLVHQQIDYLAAVEQFAPRFFHTHAKDTEINWSKLRRVGNQGPGWWRYVIPGFGEIHWGRYVGALRRAGFDGAISIEHEDGAWTQKEGMVKGLMNLALFAG